MNGLNGLQDGVSEESTGILRALKSRNYRLFFFGQSVSLIGTWMQQVAMSWLVYRLTGSALLLGTIGFCSQAPTFVVAPIAGVLADRWNRRRLLMLTQSFAMLQAFLLAFFVFHGSIQVWHLVVLSLWLGTVNGVDIPVRQSFVVEMVEEKRLLANAIALNSSMVNGARLIGPSIAGLVISVAGEGVCFLINGLSYLAVLTSIFLMRLKAAPPRAAARSFLHELKEGFGYALSFMPIRTILLLVSLMSLTGMPYAVLMPVFARDVLHGGAHTFGFLMAAAGVGSFAGTVYLASRKSVIGLGRIIALSCGLFGVGIACFSQSRNFWLSLLALLFSGYGAMTQVASCNTILQTIVEDDKRGRVMSLFTMSFMGMAPFGSLFAGAIASRVGAPVTVLIGGISCVCGAILFALRLPVFREQVLPIYREKDILP
ncbi:MFS transporter [Geomesophilobacter sediminis]|uniref:MFS transporter n=1 Tax=Geomesophilobacter sediminis TaxID=2798584 RepID=A0A8J7J5W5_9BACT|nr:MFS transporter [Geomesophilobacter sediminis]MBJ6723956.1 MFS transporter [Geomesophilobacter sediminis]